MADIEFKDFSIQVNKVIDSLAESVLEEVAGEIESQTKRNTRVASIGGGQTKNSWQHNVERSGSTTTAIVGSPLQNAIWEEFGTGEYALMGNGRKGGWAYKDDDGHWYQTIGKKPTRALWKAYSSLKNKMIKHMQERFKGGI